MLIHYTCAVQLPNLSCKRKKRSWTLAPPAVLTGVVHFVQQGFALRCPTVQRCATVYEGGLNVAVWMRDARRLTTLVEVPQSYYNRTVGLLGLWSSNTSDDFLLSNGQLLSSPDNNPPSENKLLSFGQSCMWILLQLKQLEVHIGNSFLTLLGLKILCCPEVIYKLNRFPTLATTLQI